MCRAFSKSSELSGDFRISSGDPEGLGHVDRPGHPVQGNDQVAQAQTSGSSRSPCWLTCVFYATRRRKPGHFSDWVDSLEGCWNHADRWAARAAGAGCPATPQRRRADVVSYGSRVVFRYADDDTAMRNLVVVALTDAGARGLEVAAAFGLSREYVSRLRARARKDGAAGLVARRSSRNGRSPRPGSGRAKA